MTVWLQFHDGGEAAGLQLRTVGERCDNRSIRGSMQVDHKS
jgi:hypothetical protein